MYEQTHILLGSPVPHNPFFTKQPFPNALQIIQLDEAPAPPPRTTNNDDIASLYSSSFCSSSDSDSQSEEDESICSSYCSSDEDQSDDIECDDQSDDDSVSEFMRRERILGWRKTFSSALSDSFSEPPTSSPLKRKKSLEDDESNSDDNMSHTSKRSRSQSSLGDDEVQFTSLSLGIHSFACPACDASFPTQQSLKLHGTASSNDACAAAVQYAFEE